MRGLQDKVVVVAAGGTGASDGTSNSASLGGATARRLAQEGASVVVGDLSEAAAQRTVDLIASDGGTAVAHQFDAAEEASVASLVQRAVDEYGGLDGIHSNAMDMSAATLGVDGGSDLCTIPVDVWQRTLDVGLTGFLFVARQAIPPMLERGGGAIVGTASGAIWAGEPVRVAYATAKTGMTAVMRHIASRWGREGIRCNIVAPGMVLGGDKVAALDDQTQSQLLKMGRSNRLGEADDIAGTVTFLLSDDGSWVNAQVIAVDGGQMMR